MSAVASPPPVGRPGQGSNEQHRAAPRQGAGGNGAPVVRVARSPLAAEEARMVRLGELAGFAEAAAQLGASASALQLAEAAMGEVPRMLQRLEAAVDLATRIDDDAGRAEVNETFVALRDRVLDAGAEATFQDRPLFGTAESPGQVPVGAMTEVREMLGGLELDAPERLPEIKGQVEAAGRVAGRERQALRDARSEVDDAASSLGETVSGARDAASMEARARAVAQAIRTAPASAMQALRNPAAVAMALTTTDAD